jgi:hypothetical protein
MYLFTDHPTKVCMTYFSHLKLSLVLSYHFLQASYQAFIHALFPFWYIKSSTINCLQIKKMIDNSGCKSVEKFP